MRKNRYIRVASRPYSVNETEYPFESHWFERQGSRMHYVDEGEGVPVLMLHGNPTWSFLYRNVIKELKGHCRTIAPDYPGFGFSDHPPGYNYLPQQHAEWVNGLIDHLALERFIIVVQDWGGPIGMSIAVNRPNTVAGLVIANTWSWKANYRMAQIFSSFFSSSLGRYLVLHHNVLADRMLSMMMSPPEATKSDVLHAYRAPFPTPTSRAGMLAFTHALNNSDEWLDSIERKLHLLADKPVQLIIGAKDMFFAKEEIVTRWQGHFPHCGIDRIPEAGHYLQEDSPQRVAAGIKRVLALLAVL